MGAATVVASLAARPASRAYALLLAAVVTLTVNPRAVGDVGWQLSFAALVGILLVGSQLLELLCRRSGAARAWRPRRRRGPHAGRHAGLAPLLAYHFGALPLAALPANLLALPAVAPVMWLGMVELASSRQRSSAARAPPGRMRWPRRSASSLGRRSRTSSGSRSTSPRCPARA